MKIEEIKKWYIDNQKIFFASIELTQCCNFKCKHCYCSEKTKPDLSLNQHMKIIDKLADTGCLFLNFTGGEIFTYKNFKAIYTYAKDKGFVIDLLTNASLITEEIVELFKELPPHNIAITIYGTNEEDYFKFTGDKNNYKKVLNGLNLLKESKIPFVLRTVATKTLQNSLLNGSFEKMAKDYDTTFKYDPIIFPKISGDKSPLNESLNIEQIIELESTNELRKATWKKEIMSNRIENHKPYCWSCNAGINSLSIDSQGNAFVCGLYRDFPISMIDYDIASILEHLKKIHTEHMRIVSTNECSSCEYRNLCNWCPAYARVYNNNDYDKISFFCKLTEARVKNFG